MSVETILVIDDSKLTCAFAESVLVASGYAVKLANNGAEGVRLFKESAPDLVLLDILLPDIDGFETCRQIRALPQGVDIPVVFLTGLEDIQTHRKALESGGDDLLTKPINRTELMLRVNSMVWIRRLRSDLRSGYNLIRSQRDALTRTQQQKDELTNLIVHDLKNPLTIVSGYAEILQTEEFKDPRVLDIARRISACSKDILSMVLNMLDITRSEDGALIPKINPVDMTSIIDNLRKEMEHRAAMVKVKFAASHTLTDKMFSVDTDLIRRVLENLLDNTLRYAPPGSTIRLAAKTLANKGLELRVSDEGKGIPKEYHDKIFDKYVQVSAEPNNQARTNLGLGLTFCKIAIEAHGGKIWIEDNKPTGAVFCIRLPNEGGRPAFPPNISTEKESFRSAKN